MIAALEQTYEGYCLPVRSREEGQAVLRMARRGWSRKAADPQRVAAAEELMRLMRELSRPMGGKPWKNRDELYER